MKTETTVSKLLTGMRKAGKLLLMSGTLITANVQESKGQWNLGIFPDYRTINIRSVGIGFFTPGNRPLAALHINENLMPPSPFFPQGEVFRTDCPSTQNTFWRMFRGGEEMFHINNNTGSDDISLNVVQNGSMIFSTHNLPRMKIDSSGIISIENLRCKRCFVMTNEKGELLTMEAEEVFRQLEQQQAFLMEQQKQIAFLQQEVEALKQEQEKLLCNKQ